MIELLNGRNSRPTINNCGGLSEQNSIVATGEAALETGTALWTNFFLWLESDHN